MTPSTDTRRTIAPALVALLAVVEVVAGVAAGSLALLAAAAARLAAAPPHGLAGATAGRARSVSPELNGSIVLVLAGVLAWEAGRRLVEPPEVDGLVVLLVGLAGAAATALAAWLSGRGSRPEAMALLPAASLAAAAGGAAVLAGLDAADGVAALVIAALMVSSGWRLVRG